MDFWTIGGAAPRHHKRECFCAVYQHGPVVVVGRRSQIIRVPVIQHIHNSSTNINKPHARFPPKIIFASLLLFYFIFFVFTFSEFDACSIFRDMGMFILHDITLDICIVKLELNLVFKCEL